MSVQIRRVRGVLLPLPCQFCHRSHMSWDQMAACRDRLRREEMRRGEPGKTAAALATPTGGSDG